MSSLTENKSKQLNTPFNSLQSSKGSIPNFTKGDNSIGNKELQHPFIAVKKPPVKYNLAWFTYAIPSGST
jgi:hypothetical protein